MADEKKVNTAKIEIGGKWRRAPRAEFLSWEIFGVFRAYFEGYWALFVDLLGGNRKTAATWTFWRFWCRKCGKSMFAAVPGKSQCRPGTKRGWLGVTQQNVVSPLCCEIRRFSKKAPPPNRLHRKFVGQSLRFLTLTLFFSLCFQGGESEHINLKVLGQDNAVVQFKIKKHTPLRKLMNAYCDRAVSCTTC